MSRRLSQKAGCQRRDPSGAFVGGYKKNSKCGEWSEKSRYGRRLFESDSEEEDIEYGRSKRSLSRSPKRLFGLGEMDMNDMSRLGDMDRRGEMQRGGDMDHREEMQRGGDMDRREEMQRRGDMDRRGEMQRREEMDRRGDMDRLDSSERLFGARDRMLSSPKRLFGGNGRATHSSPQHHTAAKQMHGSPKRLFGGSPSKHHSPPRRLFGKHETMKRYADRYVDRELSSDSDDY